MPLEIYIAVLTASICLLILTICTLSIVIYLFAKVSHMHVTIDTLSRDVSELIKEGRTGILEMRQVAARLTQPIKDIEHITHAARHWTDRADRVVHAVGGVAEPPLFFVTEKLVVIRQFFHGVLQSLLNSRS